MPAVETKRNVAAIAAIAAMAMWQVAATSAAGAVERDALYNVSQSLLRWYNVRDAAAIHAALSPALIRKYDLQAVDRIVGDCKKRLAEELVRLSLPTSGTRNYAFFAAHTRSTVLDMVLEIDESQKIVFWMMSENAMSGDVGCAFTAAPAGNGTSP